MAKVPRCLSAGICDRKYNALQYYYCTPPWFALIIIHLLDSFWSFGIEEWKLPLRSAGEAPHSSTILPILSRHAIRPLRSIVFNRISQAVNFKLLSIAKLCQGSFVMFCYVSFPYSRLLLILKSCGISFNHHDTILYRGLLALSTPLIQNHLPWQWFGSHPCVCVVKRCECGLTQKPKSAEVADIK